MQSEEYQMRIAALTQYHLQQVMLETRQAFIDLSPSNLPAAAIFDAMKDVYTLDEIHRLTVFFVSLCSGELDNGAVSVSREEFAALGWLLDGFEQHLPNKASVRELFEALKKAGD